MTSRNYRADIDGLRAVAIIFVYIYHLFPSFLKGGFIGVDIFFVISGFLITGIILDQYQNNRFSYRSFYKKRIKRLYPALIPVLLSSFFAGWFFLLPEELMALGKHIAGGVFYIANFTLWSEAGYFDSLPELKPLMHLWSLSIEEQFYLTWPFLLIFSLKKKICTNKVTIVFLTFSFLLNIIFIFKRTDTVFYWPITRFWEMMVGCALSVAIFNGKVSKNGSKIYAPIGILLILIALFLVTKASYFPGYWAILPTVGTALLILSPDSSFNKFFLSNKLMVRIGLISYPMYLWHWPLISFMYIKVGNLPKYADKLIITLATFTLSWLTYRFLENPIRIHTKSSKIVYLLLTSTIAIGMAGIFTFKNKGYPSRLYSSATGTNIPKEIKTLLDPEFTGYISKEWREHKCFLAKGEGPEKFSQECKSKQKTHVLLWGDSHAAALYYGLAHSNFLRSDNISQYTASACPPLLNWNGAINRLCKTINEDIFSKIQKENPEYILLHAAWYWSEYDITKLEDTILKLKATTNSKIVILDAVPNWKENVNKTIIKYFNKFKGLPPARTRFNLDIKEKDMLVRGDINQLQQVLMNLVNNAFDAVAEAASPSDLTKATSSAASLARTPSSVAGTSAPPLLQICACVLMVAGTCSSPQAWSSRATWSCSW